MRLEIIKGLGLGGAETLLVSRLRANLALGIESADEVTVISTYAEQGFYREQLRDLGVELVELHGGPLASALRLLRQVRRYDPSSILCHSPMPALVLKIGRLLRLVRCPLIEVTHSTRHHRLVLLSGRLLHRFASFNVAVSEEVSRARTAQGFRRTFVSHGGVDREGIERFQDSDGPHRLREKLGLSPGRRLAVAVGNLRAIKGHRFMIEALAEPGLEDWQLAICGDGPVRDELEALASELGVADRVSFLGSVPNAWRYLCAADLQLHYSTHEGLPVALMEGAVVGLPQLISNIPGTREFLSLTPTATSVRPADPAALAAAWRAVDTEVEKQPSSYWDIRRHAEEMAELVRRAMRSSCEA